MLLFLRLVGVRGISSPCFAYEDILAFRAGYAIDDVCGDACEMVSDFSGSIGS